MGLRARLNQLQGEANYTMAMAQALIAEAKDGFRVKLRFRFTGPVISFLWVIVKAVVTQKEPDWAKLYPDGLPVEVDAQVFLDE